MFGTQERRENQSNAQIAKHFTGIWKEKMITQEEVRKLFGYNKKTGILRWKVTRTNKVKIGDEAGYINQSGYRIVEIGNKNYRTHTIIWLGVYGYIPENDIDHKNRIRHDNRLHNLREVSRSCNMQNSGMLKNNKTGVKGVCWCKKLKKWHSQIVINKKRYHLGYYIDFDDAVCARLAGEQCLDWNVCDGASSASTYVKEYIQ